MDSTPNDLPPIPVIPDNIPTPEEFLPGGFITTPEQLDKSLERLGVTGGRIVVEYARIAFAPGDEALTIEEVLLDASIRREIMSKPMTEAEKDLIIRERYKLLVKRKSSGLTVTTANKMHALAMLAEFADMRKSKINRQRWERERMEMRRQKDQPVKAGKNIVPWGTDVRVANGPR